MPIALVNSTKAATGGTAAASLALTAPAGLNDTRLDLLIAAIRDSNSNSVISVGADGGAYTVMAGGNLNYNNGFGGDITGDFVVARKTGAPSPGTTTVSWTAATRFAAGIRMAFSDVDLTNPIDAASGSLAVGTQTSAAATGLFTVPAITTVTDGALAIAYVIASASSGTDPLGFADVAGWTKLYAGDGYVGSSSISLGVFSKPIPAAGTTGNFNAVLNQGASESWYNFAGGMLALKPDPLAFSPATPRVVANFLGL